MNDVTTVGAPTVVVSENAWGRFAPILEPAAPGVHWCVLHADGAVDAGGEQAEVAWLSNDVFYSGALPAFLDLLRADDALRWVQSAGAGVDSPMFQELIGRGIRLSTTHATNVPIAEYVIGAVLRLYQQPEQWAASAALREWRHTDFPEIWGTTWMVIGVGHIGVEVATACRAFDAARDRRAPDSTRRRARRPHDHASGDARRAARGRCRRGRGAGHR